MLNSKFLALFALGVLLALAQATCTNQVCRCKAGSSEVRTYDANGCFTCYCETAASAPTAAASTVAPTTTRAATAAPTTTRAATAAPTTAAPATTVRATAAATTTARATREQCPTFAACRCKAGSVVVTAFDDNNCPFCFCQVDGSSAPATSAPATTARATTAAATAAATSAAPATTARATTAAATTARATSPAPTTAKCGALPDCGCSVTEVVVYATDARGCPVSCQCTAAPSTARSSTAAPTTVRATSAAAATCVPAKPCACFRNDDVQTWVTDASGCRSCVCVAAPATTARATAAPATTGAAPVCAPLSVRDNCNCAPGSVKYYRTDAWGCLVCGCQAVTTLAPATTRAATTVAATTRAATTVAATTRAAAAETTRAPATTARATTIQQASGCGTARQCRCAAGAAIMWDTDSNGCAYCYCAANGAAVTDGSSSGSDSGSSAGSSASSAFVPVVVALGCVCALMVAVIAVYRYKSNHGRFPWADPEASLEARV